MLKIQTFHFKFKYQTLKSKCFQKQQSIIYQQQGQVRINQKHINIDCKIYLQKFDKIGEEQIQEFQKSLQVDFYTWTWCFSWLNSGTIYSSLILNQQNQYFLIGMAIQYCDQSKCQQDRTSELDSLEGQINQNLWRRYGAKG
ncbi:unnamed protein product [Paramecium octaurelia]|uniref:Uncharacterized protein n=1 Tax=Paramecium octaurelia TaxID=43137 RepID=A0A8S1YLE8_PAROT|nr:unnamed protein product [Paramecium octaurelia]